MIRMDRLAGYLLVPLALVGAIWLSTPVIENNYGFDEDGRFYGAMTLRLAGRLDPQLKSFSETAPFAGRVLTPWLAAVLPLPLDSATLPAPLAAMRALGLLSSGASLAVLFELVRRMSGSSRAAFVAQALYAGVFWTVKFAAYSPAYIDSSMLLLILVALLCIVAGWFWSLVAVLCLAAAQKETTLFLLPAAIAAAWAGRDALRGRFPLWVAAAVILPSAALLAARQVFPSENPYSSFDVVGRVLSEQFLHASFWPLLLIELFSGLGLLPLITAVLATSLRDRLRREPAWLLALLCALPAILGGYDKSRLLLPLAAVLIPLVGAALAPMLERPRAPQAVWLGVVLALHGYLGHHFEPMGTFADYAARMAPIHAAPPKPVAIGLARVLAVAAIFGVATGLLRPLRRATGAAAPLPSEPTGAR